MFNKLINIIQEDIIGTGNRLIAITWLLCIVGVVGLGLYFSSESRSFLGVADSREQKVSFEHPVEIKQIYVIPGQAIKKGELLMELDQSVLNEKIRTVRTQLDKLNSEKLVRSHLNLMVDNHGVSDGTDPLSVDIKDLNEQFENLEQQKKNLYVFASVDGVVGVVNFRRGERVPALTSILTLAPQSPTYIEGFLHESIHSKLEVGKAINVIQLAGGSKSVEGRVVSVGSRIIAMPPRLMANPNMQIYGREVIVEIPADNDFIPGEKVQLKPKFEITFLPQASAEIKKMASGKLLSASPQEMQFPSDLAKRFSFEPSGAIYLQDLKKYLVISDDTDNAKSATLFLVNADGRVDEQVLTVPGIDKISDLESISQDGSTVYLLTSQGVNKKGIDKKARNLFVRTTRSGISFSDTVVVEFKPLLIKAMKASKDPQIKSILKKQIDGDFEIESHFFIGKNLYLGLKNPLTDDGKAIILQVAHSETLFDSKTLDSANLSVWKTMAFNDVAGSPHRLSDVVTVDGALYATTVCDHEGCGAVWKLDDQNGILTPKLIKFFSDGKPEGLAFNPSGKTLFVAFDQKSKPGKFAHLDLNMLIENDSSQKSAKAEK